MKQKIKEVQDYFKTKILNGQFKVVNAEDIVVDILIDEEFMFSLWVHKDLTFEQWTARHNSMALGKFTEEEQAKGFEIFNPIKAEAKAERLRTSKLEQFKKLQSELQEAGIINNQSDC